ncbi:hypothetical protein BJ742DRAFT_826211 [Cladochytrium replicatum]|nr:hypothetical protein BJ742DRAFT_826211 [Cladochytrium replicatum]
MVFPLHRHASFNLARSGSVDSKLARGGASSTVSQSMPTSPNAAVSPSTLQISHTTQLQLHAATPAGATPVSVAPAFPVHLIHSPPSVRRCSSQTHIRGSVQSVTALEDAKSSFHRSQTTFAFPPARTQVVPLAGSPGFDKKIPLPCQPWSPALPASPLVRQATVTAPPEEKCECTKECLIASAEEEFPVLEEDPLNDTTITVPPSWPASNPKHSSTSSTADLPHSCSLRSSSSTSVDNSKTNSFSDEVFSPFTSRLPSYSKLPPMYPIDDVHVSVSSPPQAPSQAGLLLHQGHLIPRSDGCESDDTEQDAQNADTLRTECRDSSASFDFRPASPPPTIGPTLRRRMDRTLPRPPSIVTTDLSFPAKSEESSPSSTGSSSAPSSAVSSTAPSSVVSSTAPSTPLSVFGPSKLRRYSALNIMRRLTPTPVTPTSSSVNYAAPASALEREDPEYTITTNALRLPSHRSLIFRPKAVRLVIQFATLFVYAENEPCAKFNLRSPHVWVSLHEGKDGELLLRVREGEDTDDEREGLKGRRSSATSVHTHRSNGLFRVDAETHLKKLVLIAEHYRIEEIHRKKAAAMGRPESPLVPPSRQRWYSSDHAVKAPRGEPPALWRRVSVCSLNEDDEEPQPQRGPRLNRKGSYASIRGSSSQNMEKGPLKRLKKDWERVRSWLGTSPTTRV